MKMKNDGGKMIPPDGGWGWIVVLACGLNNVSIIIFYLLINLFFYREKFYFNLIIRNFLD